MILSKPRRHAKSGRTNFISSEKVLLSSDNLLLGGGGGYYHDALGKRMKKQ